MQFAAGFLSSFSVPGAGMLKPVTNRIAMARKTGTSSAKVAFTPLHVIPA